jgi:hypothetical protein
VTLKRDDLLKLADGIEQAANGDLRRKATDARSLYSERGYHDLTPEEIEKAQYEGQQAWQGAMQYAQDLRRKAEGMGGGDVDPRVREEAELVRTAAQNEGWLTNSQRSAWDRGSDPGHQVWDDGREKAELERGTHPVQRQADLAAQTGVMVHEDFNPGWTVERIKLVPSLDMPPVEDPSGEVPVNTNRPENDPYPHEGLGPKLAEAERVKAQVAQQEQPPASPSADDRAEEAEDNDFVEPEDRTGAQWAETAEAIRDDALMVEGLAAEETDPGERAAMEQEAAELHVAADEAYRRAAEKLAAEEEPPAQASEVTDFPTAQEKEAIQQAFAAEDAEADSWNWKPTADGGWYSGPEEGASQEMAAEQREQDVASSKPSEDYRGDAEKTADVENAAAEQADYEAEYAGETDEVDWAAVEESAGRPIPQEERNELEVARLKAESDTLVNAAEHVEGGYEWVKSEIEEAAADGEGVQERWDRQQADMDRWEAAVAQEGTEEWDVATAAGDDAADEAAEDAAVARHENYNGEPTSFSGDGMTFADGSTSAWQDHEEELSSGSAPGYSASGQEHGYASFSGYDSFPGASQGNSGYTRPSFGADARSDYGATA